MMFAGSGSDEKFNRSFCWGLIKNNFVVYFHFFKIIV